MKIVVDDIRVAPIGWKLFKTGEDFVNWREKNKNVEIEVLALDHDLGQDENGKDYMSGYQLVQHICNIENMNPKNIKEFLLHTDNPIGFKNMYHYLISADKHNILNDEVKIHKEKFCLIDGEISYSGYTWINT